MSKSTPHSNKTIHAVFYVLMISFLTIPMSCVLQWNILSGKYTDWFSLGSPPEGAIRLDMFDRTVVCVENYSEKIYCIQEPFRLGHEGWMLSTPPEPSEYMMDTSAPPASLPSDPIR